MYNDAEYQSCIKDLSAPCSEVLIDNYTFVKKPIPGVDHSGDIDPRVQTLLHILNKDPGPETIDLSDMAPLRACMNWKSLDITDALISVNHLSFKGRDSNDIALRVYSCVEAEGLKPCIIYMHGGGWIGGRMGYVENICKFMAQCINGVVISVDYRFAPEHPFPAAFNDCCDSVEYVYNHALSLGIDNSKIGVSGDSAGGNLAAACALYDRDNSLNMICYQGLAYPSLNPCLVESDYFTWSEDFYEINYNKEDILSLCVYELPVQRCFKVVEPAYLQSRTSPTNPYVAPLFADNLNNVAPAIIVVPEYDYLRQEGQAYAKRLADDGVNVKVVCFSGINHGFMEKVGQYPQAEDAIREIAKGLLDVVSSK